MTAGAGRVSAGSSSSDSTLADWAAALADRLQGGEALDLEAYAREHPERAEELRRIVPTIRMMTALGASGGSCPRRDPLGFSMPAGHVRRVLGDFELIREIGRGGMGIVYEAVQRSLKRRVAVKVLPFAAALDPRQLLRFQAEAQVVARLQHNHIVPVFATGCEDGVPYYAMQYIQGQDLAQIIRERRAEGSSAFNHDDFRTIADLGHQAAEALAFAHDNDVLHRDIKPSNLMVDDDGRLWITDFGLARVRGDLELTRTGDAPGTPRYMSPEQALGRRDVVGARSDLYSLGATLYELLTGVPAFDGDDRLGLLERIVREDPTPIRQLNPRVPADLETIVMTAMAKDPSDRYATARDNAGDLRSFLEGRPIRARRPALVARALKWSKRHQQAVVLAALVAVVAGAGLVAAAGWSNAMLRDYNSRLRGEIARADRHAAESELHRRTAVNQKRQADRLLYLATLRLAGQALETGQCERAQEILRDAAIVRDGVDPRDFAWYYLERNARREVIALRGHDARIHLFAVSSDGRSLASADVAGALILWDLAAERPRARLSADGEYAAYPAFSADGRTVAALVRDGQDGVDVRVVVWDAATGRRRGEIRPERRALHHHFAFLDRGRLLGIQSHTPDQSSIVSLWALDGSRIGERPLFTRDDLRGAEFAVGDALVVVARPGSFALLEARTGAARATVPGDFSAVDKWTLSADGGLLAAAVPARGVVVWDTRSATELACVNLGMPINHIAFGPGGATMAVLDGQRLVHLCDPRRGTWRTLHPDDLERTRRVLLAFSPDGSTLATSSHGTPGGQQPVTVWDVASGKALRRFPGRPDHVAGLGFSADGRSLYLDGGPLLRRWRLEREDRPSPAGHADEAWALAYSPDGRVLASGSDDTADDATIKLWDATDSRLIRSWRGHPATVSALAYHPSGRILASASLSATENLRLWDPETGRRLATLSGHTDKVRSVAFSPDGAVLASAGSDRTVRLWHAKTGQPRVVLEGHAGMVASVGFSTDGRILASSGTDATVRLWDVASGRLRRIIRVAEKVAALGFVPGVPTLAAADESGRITLWDVESGALIRVIRAESDELRALAIAPDGRTIAAAGMSRSIRLWDVDTGQEALMLLGHAMQVNALKFAPGGGSLASCSHDGVVRVWHAEPCQ